MTLNLLALTYSMGLYPFEDEKYFAKCLSIVGVTLFIQMHDNIDNCVHASICSILSQCQIL